MFRVFNY